MEAEGRVSGGLGGDLFVLSFSKWKLDSPFLTGDSSVYLRNFHVNTVNFASHSSASVSSAKQTHKYLAFETNSH